jgi:hypothetical protein
LYDKYPASIQADTSFKKFCWRVHIEQESDYCDTVPINGISDIVPLPLSTMTGTKVRDQQLCSRYISPGWPKTKTIGLAELLISTRVDAG